MPYDTVFTYKSTQITANWLNDVNTIVNRGYRVSDGALAATIDQYQAPSGVQRSVASKLQEVVSSADHSSWSTQCFSVGSNNFNTTTFVGSGNVVVGYNNGMALTSGYANKVFGNNCLQACTSGFMNYAFGDQVLQSLTTGSLNNGYGVYTLGFLTTGTANCGFGDDNQRYATTASYNVSMGSQALYNTLTGIHCTAIGTYAMRGTANPPDAGPGVGPSPNYSTAVGSQSLHAATGDGNTAIGYSAGYAVTGGLNTLLGTNAGFSLVTATNCVFVGNNAGDNASQPTGSTYSVAIGDSAIAGNSAVALGASSQALGDNSIALGGQTQTSATNSIAIGYGVVISSANKMAIGNSSNTGVYYYGSLFPQADNTYALGGPLARSTIVYAATGTINTSDAREKQDVRPLNDKEMAVARRIKSLVKAYRWKDAVAKKGDRARIHVGWIAQEVIAAFKAEGLDAFSYGCCCYDEWEGEEAVLRSDGTVFKAAIPAGNRYGVRYEQLIAFTLAAL